jgi:hypothetical protein
LAKRKTGDFETGPAIWQDPVLNGLSQELVDILHSLKEVYAVYISSDVC